MSKVSRRPGREERKREKRARRQAAQELRQRQAAEGLESRPKTTISNGKSAYKTVEGQNVDRRERPSLFGRSFGSRCASPFLSQPAAKKRNPAASILRGGFQLSWFRVFLHSPCQLRLETEPSPPFLLQYFRTTITRYACPTFRQVRLSYRFCF